MDFALTIITVFRFDIHADRTILIFSPLLLVLLPLHCYVKTINAKCREHYFGFINKTPLYFKWDLTVGLSVHSHPIIHLTRNECKKFRQPFNFVSEKDKNGSSEFASWRHKRNRRFNRCGRIRGSMRLAVSVFHFPHIIKFKIISCSFNKLSSERFINEMRFISSFLWCCWYSIDAFIKFLSFHGVSSSFFVTLVCSFFSSFNFFYVSFFFFLFF